MDNSEHLNKLIKFTLSIYKTQGIDKTLRGYFIINEIVKNEVLENGLLKIEKKNSER